MNHARSKSTSLSHTTLHPLHPPLWLASFASSPLSCLLLYQAPPPSSPSRSSLVATSTGLPLLRPAPCCRRCSLSRLLWLLTDVTATSRSLRQVLPSPLPPSPPPPHHSPHVALWLVSCISYFSALVSVAVSCPVLLPLLPLQALVAAHRRDGNITLSLASLAFPPFPPPPPPHHWPHAGLRSP
jgi:hypothetical protein